MKKIITVMVTVLALTACKFVSYSGNTMKSVTPKGPVETRTYDLKDFTGIEVNGHADVNFTQAEAFSVEVISQADAFDYLDVRVEDGNLLVQTKDRVQLRTRELKVNVQAPVLNKVVVNGAADLDIKGYKADEDLQIVLNGAGDLDCKGVEVPSFAITVNGAGDIDALDMEVGKLLVSVNGAGDATLSGHAGYARYTISGVGDIDARKLTADDWSKEKNGVGSIKL